MYRKQVFHQSKLTTAGLMGYDLPEWLCLPPPIKGPQILLVRVSVEASSPLQFSSNGKDKHLVQTKSSGGYKVLGGTKTPAMLPVEMDCEN